MWTAADRERYGREGLRCPSDPTHAEWALVAPLIRPAKRGGRRRSVAVREVMNGRPAPRAGDGLPMAAHPPRALPPRSTVRGCLRRWEWDGTLEAVRHRLRLACRERAGKEASPPAASQEASEAVPRTLDSKSVKAAEKGARRSARSASTRARGSRASSTTSSSTRPDCC